MRSQNDAVTKLLVDLSPEDWPRLAGFPAKETSVYDLDCNDPLTAYDRLLELTNPNLQLYLQFQADWDERTPQRMLLSWDSFRYRFRKKVIPVAVVLWPLAHYPNEEGGFQSTLPGETEPYSSFRYHLVKVWTLPAERFFEGGLGLLPLAPISALKAEDLPGVLKRIDERVRNEASESVALEIWAAISVLMGLRYDRETIKELLSGAPDMQKSVIYQDIREKGVDEGVRNCVDALKEQLLEAGAAKFGEPASRDVKNKFKELKDFSVLSDMTLRFATMTCWADVLAPVKPKAKPENKEEK